MISSYAVLLYTYEYKYIIYVHFSRSKLYARNCTVETAYTPIRIFHIHTLVNSAHIYCK